MTSNDENGQTTLHNAAEEGYASIVKVLMSHTDVDVNVKDSFGRTALYDAAELGRSSTVEVLLEGVDIDVNLKSENGRTPLHAGARGFGEWYRVRRSGYEAIVKMLLGHVRIEVNPKDEEGKIPLALAVEIPDHVSVELLCAHPDVDLDTRDNEGRNLREIVEALKRKRMRNREEDALLLPKWDECLEIIQRATEARSQNTPQTSKTVASGNGPFTNTPVE